MILPLACGMITVKKNCIVNKERKRIKFGMTSIPLRHALLGKLASKVSMVIM